MHSSASHCIVAFTVMSVCPVPVGGTMLETKLHRSPLELETKVIRRFLKISQSQRRPLLPLGPSPG